MFSNVVTSAWGDGIFTVFMALLLVASVLIAVWSVAVSVGKSQESCLYIKKLSVKNLIWIVLAAGLVLRMIISLFIRGYRGAIGLINFETTGYYEYYHSIDQLLSGGFSGLYYGYSTDVYPLTGYILTAFAAISKVFGFWSVDSIMAQFMMKLPLLLCDAASAYIIYRMARKYSNEYVGLALAGLYMFCPLFMFGSAISVTPYPILMLEMLLVFYFLVKKNYAGVIISYGTALLTAVESIFFLPVIVSFIAYNYIKSIIAYKKEKTQALKRDLFSVPCYIILTLAAIYILALPYIIKDYNANPFKLIHLLYIKPFTNTIYYGFNALTIYNIFAKNGDRMNSSFPAGWFVLIFMLIALAITLIIYLSKRNRAVLTLLAAYIYFTLSVYMIGMKELTLMVCAGLIMISFIMIKDKRILTIFSLMSLFIFINYMSILIRAGFLSNAALSSFNSTLYDRNAILLSSDALGTVVSIICSVGAVLTHVYFTLVMLDIALSDKRKTFRLSSSSFGTFVKEWLSFKRNKQSK